MYVLLKKLADSGITFVLLPYAMLLLAAGTIAQKSMGLYVAMDTFFHSWVIWAGILPLPGGYTVGLIFFLNLLARFLRYSVWRLDKAGIHLAHFGVILLILGGLVSGIMRSESVMLLSENQMTHTTESYDANALSIYKNGVLITQKNLNKLQDSQSVTNKALPFKILPLDVCRNCDIQLRQTPGNWVGSAAKMKLVNKAPEKDPETDMSGISFEIIFDSDRAAEKHLAFLYFPKPPEVELGEDTYKFSVERLRSPLPYDVKLNKFNIEFYPGSARAKSYSSNIEIFDNGQTIPAEISMNKPVSHQGYKFYQSAYQLNSDGSLSSVIAVVHDSAQNLPALGGLVTALGLLLHLILMGAKNAVAQKTVRTAVVIFSLLMVSSPAQAAVKNAEAISTFPILYNGRVMPIDSFARAQIKNLYGQEAHESESPSETLARLVFDPYEAVRLPIFKIESANLKKQFGLNNISRFYSYEQLTKGLEDTEEKFFQLLQRQQSQQSLNKEEQALLNIHSRSLYFLQMVRSFSFAMPLVGSGENEILDFPALQKDTAFLKEALQSIRQKKGDDIDRYTDAEIQTLNLNYQLDTLEKIGQTNTLFRVIPTGIDADPYAAPWQILTGGRGSPAAQEYMREWVTLMIAYQAGKDEMFERAAVRLSDMQHYNQKALKIESAFNGYNIILIASIVLFMAAGAFALRWNFTARVLSLIGLVLLMIKMIFSISILGRPPIGTLYETIIFVSAIMTGASHFIQQRKNLFQFLCHGLIGALLILAMFIKGDSFQVLEAVLNTNFWLATHVLIVTCGYGWSLLCALMAHVSLYQKSVADKLTRHVIIALFLVSFGTLLGGIWADQSWGRFWGWDPKENGALLIILWLTWGLHGRVGKQLNNLWYLIIIAATAPIVMLSWFGVNLLNVGLHSYGFTNGILAALIGFIMFECIALTLLGKRYRR